MVKGRHFFFSQLANKASDQPPLFHLSAADLESAAWQTAAFSLGLVLGAHVAVLGLGMGPKWSRWTQGPDQKAGSPLHSLGAVRHREALQLPGSGAWCFSQKGLEGMCQPHPLKRHWLPALLYSIHSWPGHHGEEGSLCSGAHPMLPAPPFPHPL